MRCEWRRWWRRGNRNDRLVTRTDQLSHPLCVSVPVWVCLCVCVCVCVANPCQSQSEFYKIVIAKEREKRAKQNKPSKAAQRKENQRKAKPKARNDDDTLFVPVPFIISSPSVAFSMAPAASGVVVPAVSTLSKLTNCQHVQMRSLKRKRGNNHFS